MASTVTVADLFAVANLARHLGVDPEAALRDANAKFTRRFSYVEARAREDEVPLAEAAPKMGEEGAKRVVAKIEAWIAAR